MSLSLEEFDRSWTLDDMDKANAWLSMQDDYRDAWRMKAEKESRHGR